jgi:hypothetical protein
MATKKAAKTATAKSPKAPAGGTKTQRTRANEAGEPVTTDRSRAAPSGPSDEELDRRDQMKSGPRRQAGPPLLGDTPEPVPTRALPDDAVLPPTDPKER